MFLSKGSLLLKIWINWFSVAEELAEKFAPHIDLFGGVFLCCGLLMLAFIEGVNFFLFEGIAEDDPSFVRAQKTKKKYRITGAVFTTLGLTIFVVSTAILACC